MMAEKRVTVSIVSHHHGDVIPLLLRDLAQHASEDVLEVIVTLNVPEPALADWIEGHEWPFGISIVRNVQPLGFGANHNQAFGWCKTPYFCVLNPDIRLADNPFPALIERLRDEAVGCVYPLQSDGYGPARDLGREIPTPMALMRRYLMPRSEIQGGVKHWINGAFMLLPSKVFMEVGGFDARYYMYCEDVDLCLRLRLRGWRVEASPRAQVQHVAQRASRRQWRHLWWHLQSLWRLWRTPHYRVLTGKPG